MTPGFVLQSKICSRGTVRHSRLPQNLLNFCTSWLRPVNAGLQAFAADGEVSIFGGHLWSMESAPTASPRGIHAPFGRLTAPARGLPGLYRIVPPLTRRAGALPMSDDAAMGDPVRLDRSTRRARYSRDYPAPTAYAAGETRSLRSLDGPGLWSAWAKPDRPAADAARRRSPHIRRCGHGGPRAPRSGRAARATLP